MEFMAIIYKEDDMFVAECVELGVVSQGKTRKSALRNLKEAVELYLEEVPELKKRNAFITSFEVPLGAKAKTS